MTELELKEIRNNEVSKYQLLEVMIPKWDKTLMILQRAVFITPLLYWRYIRENKKNGESIKSIGEKWMISTVRAKLFQTSQRFILDSFKINVEIPFFKFPHEMVIYWNVNIGMWNVVWIPWENYIVDSDCEISESEEFIKANSLYKNSILFYEMARSEHSKGDVINFSKRRYSLKVKFLKNKYGKVFSDFSNTDFINLIDKLDENQIKSSTGWSNRINWLKEAVDLAKFFNDKSVEMVLENKIEDFERKKEYKHN